MILRASEIARKLVGTHIVDSVPPSSPLVFWLQEQCRTGSLSGVVRSFSSEQPEPLDPQLTQVVEVTSAGVKIMIPCKMFERECLEKPLEMEVVAWLNPKDGRIERSVV
jgi:hypothetical protein